MAAGGIADPLYSLKSLHQILDVMEQMAIEGKANEGGDALQRFFYELYKPDEFEVKRKIAEENTDDAFDQIAALGMH